MRSEFQRSISNSYWQQQQVLKQHFPALCDAVHCDVLVIGAGITGLTTAIELASRGKQVVICEAASIGSGTTAASTGHLDASPEHGAKRSIALAGLETMQLITKLRLDAIERIGRLADNKCDFSRVEAYMYSESADDLNELREECEASRSLGLDVQFVEEIPIPRAAGGFRINNFGRINIAAYLERLVDLALERGVKIYEKTLVESIKDKTVHSLHAGDGSVEFSHVVSAVHCNHTPSLAIYAATPAYQSYVMVAEVAEELADALFWDNSDPYYYTRRVMSDNAHLLMIGGCDHRTGDGDELESVRRLEDWTRQRFTIRRLHAKWSSELFESADGLPMIGRVANADNAWIATGLSGVGLTWGTVAASLIAAGISGEHSEVMKTLSPDRLGISQPSTWLKEQLITAKNYSERVMPASSIEPESIAAGEGQVGKLGGEHVAYCRDSNGCAHALNPICSHMGGVLHWNAAEKTWDCPIHGGRFAADGKRIYGPPNADMEPIQVNIEKGK